MSEYIVDPNIEQDEPTQSFQELLEDPSIHPALRVHLDRLVGVERQSETEVLDSSEATGEDRARRYTSRYTSVISTPLTVDTIDTYAQTALADLIDLSEEVTAEFRKTPDGHTHFESNKELEDRAYAHFGLPDITESLDYIDSVDQDIRGLDKVIGRVQAKDKIILPPDAMANPIVPGNGEGIKKPNLLPRLKTLLFILERDYDIDLDDPERLQIELGVTTEDMIRGESYYAVSIPELNRTVLVCDEEDNATFIIDTEILQGLELTSEQLLGMTKSEINELLERHEGIGKKMIQSKLWVKHMRAYLEQIKAQPLESNDESHDESYLMKFGSAFSENPDKTLYSLNELCSSKNEEGVLPWSYTTLKNVAKDLGIEGWRASFSHKNGIGYDAWQVNQMRDELIRRNLLDRKPEDMVYSINEIASTVDRQGFFPVSYLTISSIAKQLGIEGEQVNFNTVTGGGRGVGYDAWQINQIRDELYRRNLIERKPIDRVYSGLDIATSPDKEGILPVNYNTILRITRQLGIKGQHVNFSMGAGIGFDAWQINQIRDELYRRNLIERPPEEMIYSANELGSTKEKEGVLPVVTSTIYRAARALGIEGVRVNFGGGSGIGYDAWQVNQIRDELIRRNLIERKPEDRVYSARDLETTKDKEGIFPLSNSAIGRIAQQIGIEGEKVKFGSGSGPVGIGYDAWQVNQIRDELIRRNLIERKPEDRVYSARDLTSNPESTGIFNVNQGTIMKVAKQIGIEGEKVNFSSGSGIGYDAWQVNQIRDELYRRNLIERKREDRLYSTSELSAHIEDGGILGVRSEIITKIATGLGIQGQSAHFGGAASGGGSGIGYDAWQVNEIRDELIRRGLVPNNTK